MFISSYNRVRVLENKLLLVRKSLSTKYTYIHEYVKKENGKTFEYLTLFQYNFVVYFIFRSEIGFVFIFLFV